MRLTYFTGHSLGAAEATLAAFSRWKRRMPVAGLYTFGLPRPGNSVIGTMALPVWRNIRNDCGRWPDYDIVTSVPWDIEKMLDYATPTAFEAVSEPPAPNDLWGPLGYHHSQLYQAGCLKLAPNPTADVSVVDAINAVVDLYNKTGEWEWTNFVDGRYCALRIIKGINGKPDANLVVFRGSETELDWFHDLDTLQTSLFDARVSRGFWQGPAALQPVLDQILSS